jgi:hypothetical protein
MLIFTAALLSALLPGCAGRHSQAALNTMEQNELLAGWQPCMGAPGNCVARLTIPVEKLTADGCYAVVTKSPDDGDRIQATVYRKGIEEPLAVSGAGNPVQAHFCYEPEYAEPLVLEVWLPERAPAGASMAAFRDD